MAEQTRHETRSHILEGKGGTMKEFETVDVVADFHHGAVERQCVVNDATEVCGGNILTEEVVGHLIGYLLEREVLDVVEKSLWHRLDALGHVEASVLCKSFHHCLMQGGEWRFVVGGVILHIVVRFFS